MLVNVGNRRDSKASWLGCLYCSAQLFRKLGTFLFVLLFCSTVLHANPEGGTVTAGNVTITSPSENTVQINQTSNKAIIDWSSFNIAPNQQTIFSQPSSRAIILNRIDPEKGRSAILGKLTANGQVWLINPAGIFFGPLAQVNVASLIATTANINNDDFIAGKYRFLQQPGTNGSIINEGMITVADNGLVALVAPGVANSGTILARLGTVVLAAGNEFILDFYGDELINFSIDGAIAAPARDENDNLMEAAVENSGKIMANGGKVLLTANTAEGVMNRIVNMDGYIEAKAATRGAGGEIVLMGGDQGVVQVSGKMIASGKKPGQTGGTIKVLGNKVAITDNAKIDASGNQGGGTILIGGNAHGAGPEKNAAYTYVGQNTLLNASALKQGDGGNVVVWSDLGTQFHGTILARGGAHNGNGGWVETSGKENLLFRGLVDTSANNGTIGTLLLDPKNIIIANSGGSTYQSGTNNLFANNTSGTTTILASGTGSISAQTANVILQANNDITFSDPVSITSSGKTLTVQAGRSIFVNANVGTRNAAISMTANDSSADSSNRDTGAGNITLGAGAVISSGTGLTTLTIGSSTTSPFSPGSITQAETGGISASNITLVVPTTSSGNIGSNNTPILTTSTGTLTITSGSGGAFISNTGNLTLATPTLATNNPLSVTSSGVLTLPSAAISTGTGDLTLQSLGGSLTTAGNLTTNGGNILLVSSRAMTIANALNAGSGTITLNVNTGGTGANAFNMSTTGSSLTTTNTTSNAVAINVNAAAGGTGTAALRDITVGSGGSISVATNTGDNTTGGSITQTAGTTLDVGTNGIINLAVPTASTRAIGTLAANILTTSTGGTLNLTMGSGGAFVTNTGNLTLAAPTVTSANYPLSVIASGVLTLPAFNFSTGTGALSFQSNGGTLATNGTLTSGSGAITLNANTGITISHAISSMGLIAVNANQGGISNLGMNISNGGSITTTSNNAAAVVINVNTASGGTGDVVLGNTAATNISATGGTNARITIATNTGANTTGGSITQTSNNNTLSSSGIILSVPTATTSSIGSNSQNILTTTTGSLTLTAGSGGAFIANTGNATLVAPTLATNSPLSVISSGVLTLPATTISTGTGDLTLASLGGTLTTAGNLTTNGGNILLISSKAMTIANALNAGSGTITLNVNTGGTGANVFNMSTVNSSLTTTNTTTNAVAINVNAAGGGTGTAALRNITVGNGGSISVATNTGSNTTGGSITQTAGTTLDVGTNGIINLAVPTASASAIGTNAANILTTSSGGTLNLTMGSGGAFINNTGDLLFAAPVTTSTNYPLSIIASGTLTLPAFNFSTGTGALTLKSNGGSLTTNGTLTAGTGVITLTAGDTLTLAHAINSASTINLNANQDGIGSQGIVMNSSASITTTNTTASAVALTVNTSSGGTGDAQLNNITTGNGGTITVSTAPGANTTGGSITQLAGGLLDANATGATNTGSVILTTPTGGSSGIGTLSNKIQTRAGTAITLSAGAGGAFVSNIGNSNGYTGASVLGATTSAGDFNMTAAGSISQSGATILNISGTPTFTVTNTNLDIALGNANIFNTTPIFTNNGNVRDVTLRNTSANASIPILPTNLRNLTLTFNNADIHITNPLSFTGTLTATTGNTFAVADGVTLSTNNTAINITATNLNLNTSGALSSGTAATVLTQNTAGGTIGLGNTTGNMSISGDQLQRITAGSFTLNAASNGQIFVDGITATHSANIAGTTTLAAVTGTTSSITFQNNNSTFAHALTASSTNGITINDVTLATNNAALNLTAKSVDLGTSGSLNSGTATTTITQNTASDTIGIGNTAGTNMTISGNMLQRITAGSLAIVAPSNGQIVIDGITANNSANISGTTSFTATAGTSGSISVVNNSSTFAHALTLVSDSALTIGNGVNLATLNSALSITALDLDLGTTGTINTGTANTSISNVGATMIELGNPTGTAGRMGISGSELQRITTNNLSITTATGSVIRVDGINASDMPNIAGNITLTANAGAGSITFLNNASTFAHALTAATANNFTVNNGVTLTTNNGAISITAKDLDLQTTGALNSGSMTTSITSNTANSIIGLGDAIGTMTISNAELHNISAGALTINAASNGQILVDNVTATDTANIAGITTLSATAGTLGSITFQNNASTFAHGLTISTDNALTVNDGLTLSTNNSALSIVALSLNLNTTGAINSGSGDTTIRGITGDVDVGDVSLTDNMLITHSVLQRITANNLTIANTGATAINVDNVAISDTANIANTISFDATNSSNGVVTFQNNASSFKTLTALGQNAINVNAPVTTTVGNLSLNANSAGDTGVLNLNANLTAAGSLTLTAPAQTAGTHNAGIILGAPVTLTGNSVILSSELNGANNLTISSGSGGTTFSSTGAVPTTVGLITPLSSLTITGSTNLNITDIRTSGAQTYNSPITLGSDIAITSTSNGNINFANTVNGTFNLTVNTGGMTTFGDNVGSITPLASILTNSAGSITLSGNTMTTIGAQTYNDAMTLGVNTTLTTNNANITLGNSVNSLSSSTNSLTLVSGTGVITLNGAIGETYPLQSFSAVNSGVNNDIVLTNNLTAINNISITAGRNITLNNGNLISTSGNIALTGTTGTIQEIGTGFISGGLLTTNTAGGTTLSTANTLTSFNATNTNGGNITLINTATPLTITGITQNNSGNVNITNSGALITSGLISTNGGNVSLSTLSPDSTARTLTLNANITTAGGSISANAANPTGTATALIINGILNSTGSTGQGMLTVGSGIALNTAPILGIGDITLQGNGLDLTLGNLNFAYSAGFAASRYLTINGSITTTNGANLNLSGDANNTGLGGVIVTNLGSINSSGDLTVRGSSLAGLAGANANAAIEIQTGASIQSSGAISLLGNTGNSDFIINSPLQSANAINMTPAGTGTIQLGADITSSHGAINFAGPTVLTSNATIYSNGNTITFSGPVNGAQNLSLNAGPTGDIYFGADTGNTTPLANLAIIMANNVMNGGTMSVGDFTQLGGNITNFGNALAANSAALTAKLGLGTVNVATLTLNINAGNLQGTVDGLSGTAATKKITVVNLNQLAPGQVFFNGLDITSAFMSPSNSANAVDASVLSYSPTGQMSFTYTGGFLGVNQELSLGAPDGSTLYSGSPKGFDPTHSKSTKTDEHAHTDCISMGGAQMCVPKFIE